MGSSILYRNVPTSVTLGNEPHPLSSIMPIPLPVPIPCSVNESLFPLHKTGTGIGNGNRINGS